MKFLVVILCLLVALMMGLLGTTNSRKNLEFQLTKSISFENIKKKVSRDVLREFESNIAEANTRLDQTKKELDKLTIEVKTAQETASEKNTVLNTCNSDLSKINSDISALEAQKSTTETEFQKIEDSLKQQINNLKQEHQNRSKVCNYIGKGSTEGMKLCGIVPPSQVEKKPEPAKAAQ
ncbi:hypothetical protein Baya_4441 [Bagarius yarrelli]|uniref:Uncharacterized protein n=1 Tax=Bagarius yarrelli TaxID=175774 RepID=A0A556TQ65_BAGYA|nr:hypothetical protein Baya_4441 [Bagarius yarrelli]